MKKHRFTWVIEVWRALGRANPFSSFALGSLAAYPFLGTLFYEGSNYGYTNPRFWFGTLISYLALVMLYVILMLPFVKIPALSKSAIGKTVAVVIVFISKSVIMVFIVFEDVEVAMLELFERLPGDVSVVLILWTALAVVSTSNADYLRSVVELNRVTEELFRQRSARASAAREMDRSLAALTRSTLRTELDRITKSLRGIQNNKDAWRISVEIKELLETKVRPLSRAVLERLDLVPKHLPEDASPLRKREFVNLKFMPRQDTRILVTYLAASLNIFITIAQLSNLLVALQVQAVSLGFLLLGVVLRSIWAKNSAIGALGAIAWMSVFSVATYLPMLWAINHFAREHPELEVIQITAFVVVYLLLLGFSFWSAFNRNRATQLAAIAESQIEIRREISLIDQIVWVTRRKWAYVIHGAVQGALTVAQSRLLLAEKIDGRLLRTVLTDIEKAKKALSGNADFTKSTQELTLEISKSWQGLCEVSFQVDRESLALIDQDEFLRTSFIEISKELVGNAHRHGKAKKVWIAVLEHSGSELRLVSTNDGIPFDRDSVPGLGFELLNQLSSRWEIADEIGFVLTCDIPVATKPFA